MDHQRRVGVLHRLAVEREAHGELLRVGHELARHHERAHRRERVVGLGDQPVAAVARVAPAAAVRDVVLDGVAEDVVARFRHFDPARLAADHDPELALPVDLRAAGRDPDRLSGRDHRARQLDEHVGIPARLVGLALPDARDARRAGRGSAGRGGGRLARGRPGVRVASGHLHSVLAVVHRDVQHRRRVADRRERADRREVHRVRRPARRSAHVRRDREDARAQRRVVAGDQRLQVGRRVDARALGQRPSAAARSITSESRSTTPTNGLPSRSKLPSLKAGSAPSARLADSDTARGPGESAHHGAHDSATRRRSPRGAADRAAGRASALRCYDRRMSALRPSARSSPRPSASGSCCDSSACRAAGSWQASSASGRKPRAPGTPRTDSRSRRRVATPSSASRRVRCCSQAERRSAVTRSPTASARAAATPSSCSP